MAKEVVIARLCGFERVEFNKKDGSGTVAFFRTYFDFESPNINGIGTASCTIFSDQFSRDRLEMGNMCYIVLDNGKADYCGKAPVPSPAGK